MSSALPVIREDSDRMEDVGGPDARRARSPSRERQRRRVDDGSRGSSPASAASAKSRSAEMKHAAFEADAAWAGQEVAAAAAAPAQATRRRADDKRKRHQYESDDSADSSPPRAAPSPPPSRSSSAAVAASASSSRDPNDSPSGITALLPQSSPASSSADANVYHDPSIYGCRKVNCYTRLNTIDEGTYGVVHRATNNQTGELVALKKIKLTKEICASGFPITSLREINILLSLSHPNIVGLKEIVTSGHRSASRAPKGIYMVMELADHDLKVVQSRMVPSTTDDGQVQPPLYKPFRIPEIKCLLKQLLEGMAYLHENWILHRDLKTSNLLYTNQGQLKICDFGLARRYGDPLGNYTPLVVTLWYRAPELLFGTKTYSSAIDVWSIGCIFAELLTNTPLFNAQTEIEQISRILKVLGTPDLDDWPEFAELDYAKTYSFNKVMPNRLRESFPVQNFTGGNVLSEMGFHLMSQMLCYNPAKRITAAEALRHPYFSEAPLPQSVSLMPTFPISNQKMHTDQHEPNSDAIKGHRVGDGFYL